MSIPYKVIQRKNPQRPTDPPKYYAQDVTVMIIETEELAKEVAAASSMSAGDMLNIFTTISEIAQREMARGNAVRLKGLCLMSPTLSSVGGAATPEEVRRLEKKTGVGYRTAPELQRALDNAGETYTGEVTNLTPSQP